MRIVFHCAIKERAAVEYPSECTLQKLNGVNLGSTYQNDVSFEILLKYVAKFLQNVVIEKLNSARFLAVMTDGSTTQKSAKYEAVGIRYVQEDDKITNSFIGLCKVESGKNGR